MQIGIFEISDPMHRVEEIFTLRVDAYAQLLAFPSQSLLQFSRALLCACDIGDYDHRKLPLHHGLVYVDYAALCSRKYLCNRGHNTRVVMPKTEIIIRWEAPVCDSALILPMVGNDGGAWWLGPLLRRKGSTSR